MAIVRLDKDGSNLWIKITEELGQFYSWEVSVRKVVNREVVEIERHKSTPDTVTRPFQLSTSPEELHDARIVWIVFILSPDRDDSTDPYEVNVQFIQDGNVLEPTPSTPPPPHTGELSKGQAIVNGDVFIFTS